MPIPAKFEVNGSVTAGGKARHRSEKSLVLLFLRQQGNQTGRILLSASAPVEQATTAQDFVSKAVHDQVGAGNGAELTREASVVEYGGLHFYRADYKVSSADKAPLYVSYVYTKFRGYLIGETLASVSSEGLDEAANSLQAISFRENQINPNCVMAPVPAKIDTPQRVRISQGIAVGLLIKKVSPEYPPVARQAGIQGQVVLQAEIDKEGTFRISP